MYYDRLTDLGIKLFRKSGIFWVVFYRADKVNATSRRHAKFGNFK